MGLLKLGGIASGLDTESLVKQLMAIERRPVTLLEQRNDTLTTKANAWRDLNARLLTLDNRIREMRGFTASVWDARKAMVTDATVLTAQADSTAQAGTYKVEVVNLATAQTWKSNLAVADPSADLGFSGTLKISGGTGDGKTLTVAATDSLNEIATNINARKNELGFGASVLTVGPNDNRLVLTGIGTGTGKYFEVLDDPADPLSSAAASLQITTGTGTATTTATDGSIRVNNIDITTTSNTVKGAIPGATLNVLKPGATATVTVAADNQKAIEAVKGFVEQYNSVVDFMNSLTKFDEKTKKAGALLGEGTILNLRMTLSRILQDPVPTLPSSANTLAMVGITTEAYAGEGSVTGKLKFDQAKFTAALEKDPDSMMKLFTLNDGTTKGAGTKLAEVVGAYSRTGGLVLKQASALDGTIERAKERIKNFDEVLLPQKEKRLRAQFITLEKSMTMFQNQGNWLTAQLEGLSKK